MLPKTDLVESATIRKAEGHGLDQGQEYPTGSKGRRLMYTLLIISGSAISLILFHDSPKNEVLCVLLSSLPKPSATLDRLTTARVLAALGTSATFQSSVMLFRTRDSSEPWSDDELSGFLPPYSCRRLPC